MAKHRTKEQKQKAAEEYRLQWQSSSPVTSSKHYLFGSNPQWVYQDLRRTALVSCLIVGILVFVYFLTF